MADAVRAWIEAHPVLDAMFQGVLFLALGTAGLLLVLFLLRLLRPANVRRLLVGDSRAVRSLKLLGQEIEFFENLETVEQNTQAALEDLNARLTTIETVLYNRVLPKLTNEEPDLGL